MELSIIEVNFNCLSPWFGPGHPLLVLQVQVHCVPKMAIREMHRWGARSTACPSEIFIVEGEIYLLEPLKRLGCSFMHPQLEFHRTLPHLRIQQNCRGTRCKMHARKINFFGAVIKSSDFGGSSAGKTC